MSDTMIATLVIIGVPAAGVVIGLICALDYKRYERAIRAAKEANAGPPPIGSRNGVSDGFGTFGSIASPKIWRPHAAATHLIGNFRCCVNGLYMGDEWEIIVQPGHDYTFTAPRQDELPKEAP